MADAAGRSVDRQGDSVILSSGEQNQTASVSGPVTAEEVRPGLRGRDALGLAGVLGLLALAWAGTFSEMWHRWYPAWRRMPEAPLLKRLSEGDSYYSHGPLVLLTSLVLVAVIYRRVGLPTARSGGASIGGWLILIGSVLVHLGSVYARVMFASGFALLGVLTGLLLVWGGWPLLRAYGLAVGMLLFMVPLPEVAIGHINFYLKGLAGDMAVWITDRWLGIPCIKVGSFIYLPPGADGQPKSLVMDNVCGGLRSLISLTFFAALFAMVCRVRGIWRILMLVLAVPVAVLCNVVRITAMNSVAHVWSAEAVGPGTWFHDLSGIAVFILALAILLGIERLIVALARWTHQTKWVDSRVLGYLETLKSLPATGSRYLRPLRVPVAAVLVVNLGLSWWWGREGPRYYHGSVAAGAVPREIELAGQRYLSQDLPLDARTLAILETDDYLYRRFYQPESGQSFDLVIVFSPDNRKGTHPPEVCLEGSGSRVLSMREQPVRLDGRVIPMRELITQDEQGWAYHLYVYKSGSRYTSSFFMQQATIFLNGLLGRNAAGALIRLSCTTPSENIGPSRQWMITAAETLMPMIDRNLE